MQCCGAKVASRCSRHRLNNASTYLDTLENFQLRFSKAVENINVGVRANLRSTGYYTGAEAHITEQDDLTSVMSILTDLPKENFRTATYRKFVSSLREAEML
jgi:hypothetical protein